MSAIDPIDHPHALATNRRWLLGLAGLLAILTAGVMATATIGSTIQTGVRAYVGGEGLWSKSEKNAVIHLERYGVTHAEADWNTYRSDLEQILGDRRARLELEKGSPSDAVVLDGFVAGGNAAEDVPSMAMLFRTFRHLSYIDEAIAIWTEADAEIDRLDAIAERIRGAVGRAEAAGHATVIGLGLLTAEVDASNTRLSELEARFSKTLGEGARWVQSVLLVVMAAILVLLVTITATLGRFILGRLRSADLSVAESVRASEARLRLLVDHLPAIVWTTDADLLMTSITGDGLARLDIEEEGLVGRSLISVFQFDLQTGNDDRELADRAHREALRGHPGSYRMTLATRVLQVHVEPLLVGGQIIGVVGLGLDLTDGLVLEARLEQATRLESIGRLAGGVAHDFNNLLTAISGYADLLTEGLPDGEQRHDAEEIQRAARRAADLTNQLLAFSQRQVLKPELVSLNTVIEDMRHMLGRLLGEDVRLDVELDPALPAIVADPGQLERVILNLAVNARDAMADGGTLTISTSRTVVPSTSLSHEPEGSTAGGKVEAIAVRVRDTGCGMDGPTRARIFEPFFTTKGRGKGTGLGLSTVYGIVDQSGGSIDVESAPGAGTTFTIVLAAATPTAAAAGLIGEPADPRERHGVLSPITSSGHPAASEPTPIRPTALPGPAIDDRPLILVAEDEDTVRGLVVHVLEGAGFRVVAAVDGREALELAKGHDRFDALLTDVIMPNVNGPSLAHELLGRQPDLPVLFLSGYTGDELGERGVIEPGVNLMTKPFRPTELVERVRALLGEADPSIPLPLARPADVA
jgi:two-component system cell cycle sensor histidine kinase/response regulator CckA